MVIRTVGGGNVGATNTFRTIWAWAGVPVFVIDLFKGVEGMEPTR